MQSKCSMRLMLFAAAVALVAAISVPSAQAQQFSDWSTPANLNALVLSDGTHCPAIVNSVAKDQHPAISKDGLTLIFASTRVGSLGDFDLWVTERDSLDDCWQTPVPLPVNTVSRDFAPNLSVDGHWLFFHSNRPGGCGNFDLYATYRQDKRDDLGWEPPINLGCILNTSGHDAGPNFFDDGKGTLFLYFTRNPDPATNPVNGFDIYVSTCTADLSRCNRDRLWSPGALVNELSTASRDTRTAIRRRDGLEMIITTNRPGGVGGLDLWVSTRATASDPWSLPVDLGPVVNSTGNDGAPSLSWDGTELYFYSDRTGVPGTAGDTDLYVSKRTKLTGSN